MTKSNITADELTADGWNGKKSYDRPWERHWTKGEWHLSECWWEVAAGRPEYYTLSGPGMYRRDTTSIPDSIEHLHKLIKHYEEKNIKEFHQHCKCCKKPFKSIGLSRQICPSCKYSKAAISACGHPHINWDGVGGGTCDDCGDDNWY